MPKLCRRRVTLLEMTMAMAVALFTGPALAMEWVMTKPEAAGFGATVGNQIDAAVERGELSGLHAVLVARQGKLAVERYYEGEDERWGRPLGKVVFGPDVLHDLRSVTKSIVGLLYGVALAEGQVPPLGAPLVDQFAYEDLAADPARRRLEVVHALTMTLGTEWDETLPYRDVRNSEIAMEMADDRYRFILDRPLVDEPGSRWVYNGGATAVLGHLLAQGTGMALDAYAEARLFRPLGIEDVDWVQGSNGEPAAASGLRLRPRDLLKIGQLVLDGGQVDGAQVVPGDWLEAATTPKVEAEDGLQYGYQWWLGRGRADGRRWIAGFGNGGQRLIVIPALDLVVAVLAGNYNQPDAWRLSVRIMGEFLLPALREG